jgi:hypothetical protein
MPQTLTACWHALLLLRAIPAITIRQADSQLQLAVFCQLAALHIDMCREIRSAVWMTQQHGQLLQILPILLLIHCTGRTAKLHPYTEGNQFSI